MPAGDLPPSPAAQRQGASLEEALAYYKTQYEQLEVELQEFQASSRELEAELERDIEQADKRELELNESIENAKYEAAEWKTKYKQSKTESTAAQSALEKEVTKLREANRGLMLRLRDIEVANDDIERQARHTAGSLEDLEGKYNVAIERSVMLDEEVRNGEKERETLRIEYQRIKDQLSDLGVEHEITHKKLSSAEAEIQMLRSRKVSPLSQAVGAARRPSSPYYSETSTSATTLSSPTVSTPPPPSGQKDAEEVDTVQSTPPSPPFSDGYAAPANPQPSKIIADIRKRAQPQTPVLPLKKRSTTFSSATSTPRPSYMAGTSARPGATTGPRHSRGPSVPIATPSSLKMQPPTSTSKLKPPSRPSFGYSQEPLPRSGSLYQIRGLTAKIQSLEKRVQTVRSKLPAPTSTPPKASPRGSAVGGMPPTVTIRSNRKRQSQSTNASSGERDSIGIPIGRLSFGVGQGAGTSAAGGIPGGSRPSSRASLSSTSQQLYARPASRTSMSGARTPISSSYSIPEQLEGSSSAIGHPPAFRRPRSSISGSYAQTHGHGSRKSISGRSSAFGLRLDNDDINTAPLRSGTPLFSRNAGQSHSSHTSGRSSAFDDRLHDDLDENDDSITPTALRRSTMDKGIVTGIPVPSGIPRRQSGGVGGAFGVSGLSRRQSSEQMATGELRPPSSSGRQRTLSEVEETY